MNLKEFREVLDILTPYYKDQAGYHLGADHDVIYLYATDSPVSESDVKKLFELGAGQEGIDGFEDYDPEEGWYVFV